MGNDDDEAENYEDLDLPSPIQWARFGPIFTGLGVLAAVVGLGVAGVVWVTALTR